MLTEIPSTPKSNSKNREEQPRHKAAVEAMKTITKTTAAATTKIEA